MNQDLYKLWLHFLLKKIYDNFDHRGGGPEGRRSCMASHSSYPFNGLVMTWRCPSHLQVCVISQGKLSWNSPPQLGVEKRPRRGQTVRIMNSPTEWLRTVRKMSYITDIDWVRLSGWSIIQTNIVWKILVWLSLMVPLMGLVCKFGAIKNIMLVHNFSSATLTLNNFKRSPGGDFVLWTEIQFARPKEGEKCLFFFKLTNPEDSGFITTMIIYLLPGYLLASSSIMASNEAPIVVQYHGSIS